MPPQSPQMAHTHRGRLAGGGGGGGGAHPAGVVQQVPGMSSADRMRANGAGQADAHPYYANGEGADPGSAAASAAAAWAAAASMPSGGGDKIKCVFLGDGAVGKTSLIVSYTTNGYPSEYVPTAIDTYDVVVNVDGEPVTFEMCDTPGQDDFDTLRPLCYPNTDVFLICFSVVSPSSFANIREKWIPELKKSYRSNKMKHIPPLVLVGTQSDLREDVTTLVQLAQTKEQPVSEQEARRLASHLGCETYVESSSLTQKNLKEVFDEAIVAGLKGRRKKERAAAKSQQRRDRQDGDGTVGGGCLGVKRCSIM